MPSPDGTPLAVGVRVSMEPRGEASIHDPVDVRLRPVIDDAGNARLHEPMAGAPQTAGTTATTPGLGQ